MPSGPRRELCCAVPSKNLFGPKVHHTCMSLSKTLIYCIYYVNVMYAYRYGYCITPRSSECLYDSVIIVVNSDYI